MGFTMNHNDVMGDGPIPEGNYEVVVKEAKEDVTKNGVQHISLDLVIRNDIKQGYQNAHIWAKLWKSKETGQYSMKMFNTIGKALNIPNGKYYNSLNELLQDFNGKVCTVKVKHEEYNGYINAKVAAWNNTKFPNCNHLWNAGQNGNAVPGLGQEVSFHNNDVPF